MYVLTVDLKSDYILTCNGVKVTFDCVPVIFADE